MPRVKKTEPMDKPVEQLKLENPKTSQPLNEKAEAKEHQEHQEYRAATSVIPISELDAENGLKEALVNSKTPTKIHLIDGEKGGVGKSLFARTLMQYAIDKQMKLTLVDADRTNADVSEVYSDGAKTASEE